MGEIDGVLDDVALFLQRRRDVDRPVANQQRPGISRHVHDVDMTYPAACPQAGVDIHHFVHQLVGVQRPLHQQLRLARADQGDAARRRSVAVRGRFQPEGRDVHAPGLSRGADPGFRSHQDRRDQPQRCGFNSGLQGDDVAGMHDRRADGWPSAAPRQQCPTPAVGMELSV